MAAESGRTHPSVEQQLLEQGSRFDFFQAIRLLEGLRPQWSRLGRATKPDGEPVRLQTRVGLDFPASAVHGVRAPEDGVPTLEVTFLGLVGQLGTLPRHYTELLVDRRKEEGIRAFLHLFHHRGIALFYRAWAKYRPLVEYEAAHTHADSRDHFATQLRSLFGMGTDGLADRLRVKDDVLPFYAGVLSQQRRSAANLKALLEHYFEVGVEVIQLIGQWLPIGRRNQTRIGARGQNHALGVSTIAGAYAWDQQAGFRVKLGPLRWAQYNGLLPGSPALRELVQLTRYFAGQELDFEIQLQLRHDEVPPCSLGQAGPTAARLGWSAWIGTIAPAHDPADAIFGGTTTALGAIPKR